MQIAAVSKALAQIDQALAPYSSLRSTAPAIDAYVTAQTSQWGQELAGTLKANSPFASHEQRLREWQEWNASSGGGAIPEQAMADFAAFCKVAGLPPNTAFWREQLKADKLVPVKRLLFAEWEKKLGLASMAWELEQITARRMAFIERLSEILSTFSQLDQKLRELGLEPGVLLDLSAGSLTPQDIQQFMNWAKYLAEDDGVKALCELLGRLRQIEWSETIERVKSLAQVHARLPDINAREEIVGIKLGREIAHILPSELMLLSDPDTAILFDLKYVESRLACFDMQGMQNIQHHVETEEERRSREEQGRGPFIICVDTSGSMSGAPETVAKAVALFLATKAREEKRSCFLINFSGIQTLDLGQAGGLKSLLHFLKMSFHGGTDATPALSHALSLLSTATYRNADVLMVSDFIMAGLPAALLERIRQARSTGNKFYSLVVGSCFLSEHARAWFDKEWVFNPGCGRIHDLLTFKRSLR